MLCVACVCFLVTPSSQVLLPNLTPLSHRCGKPMFRFDPLNLFIQSAINVLIKDGSHEFENTKGHAYSIQLTFGHPILY